MVLFVFIAMLLKTFVGRNRIFFAHSIPSHWHEMLASIAIDLGLGKEDRSVDKKGEGMDSLEKQGARSTLRNEGRFRNEVTLAGKG